jgi:hypothetical protein
MTTPAFYTALANVLVSHDLLRALHRDPERVARRYGLCAAELELLRSAPPAGVHLTQRMIRAKRFTAVEFLMPQAARLLAEWDDYLTLSRYVDDVLPRPDVDMLRAVTQGTDLLAWLAREDPPGLPPRLVELARFELTVAELAADPAAGAAARTGAAATAEVRTTVPAAPAGLSTPDWGRPRLAADTRLLELSYDVLALPAHVTFEALAAAGPGTGAVLLRKRWQVRAPDCYRLGAATAALLRHCDGTRTAGQVVDAVTADRPELRTAALAALDRLAAEGAVTPTDPTLH